MGNKWNFLASSNALHHVIIGLRGHNKRKTFMIILALGAHLYIFYDVHLSFSLICLTSLRRKLLMIYIWKKLGIHPTFWSPFFACEKGLSLKKILVATLSWKKSFNGTQIFKSRVCWPYYRWEMTCSLISIIWANTILFLD